MSAAGSLHLAWRYIAHHRVRTLLLALALGLTLALPLAVRTLLRIAQQEWRARAQATPLVLGAKGSALELTLNALYFRRQGVDTIPAKSTRLVRDTSLGQAIPLHVRFHSQESPIVGTSLDYFGFRGLQLAEGHTLGRLGDCVVGAEVARKRNLKPGSYVMSSPEQVFDLAGVYPLNMRVTGILAENHTADDQAIFVDVKTAWLIEGIAHGHEDLVKTADATQIQEKQEGNVVGSKAVRMYAEVTDANIGGFHFHGDSDTYSISGVLVVPKDAKSQALLLGKFQNGGEQQTLQLVQPPQEMDALLATLVQAERFALLLLLLLGVAVVLIVILVFALSFRLRRREFATLEDIGISRSTIALVKTCEILLVSAASLAIVAITLWLVQHYGAVMVRAGVQ
ncbi:ABC transporter permease [Roseimicrobium gellanilyticum]|nr:ABC transporter permease [Roseimicrobium gellanilyticum]